jgi:hypothetical protein
MRSFKVLALLGVVCAALAACGVLGRGDGPPLSRVEIRDALNGRTLQGLLSDGEMGLVSFDEDGQLTLTSDDGGPTVGRWRASDEGLCIEWQRPDPLPEQCYQTWMLAEGAYQLRLPDGTPYLTLTVAEPG